MQTTKITKIILERNGEERVAVPATPAELKAAEAEFKKLGLDINRCSCGAEVCWQGYVWRCAYGPSGECQWFKSDWRCNE
jgi:hypothetical protein